MRLDLLIASAGLNVDLAGDDEALHELLVAEGVRFLTAGGVVSLEAWAGLSAASRVALTAAGERVRATYAALAGVSTRAPRMAEAIARGEDPEDIAVRAGLEAVGRAMSAKLGESAK